MRIHQRRAFVEYSATFDPKVVHQWEAMVQAWERDPPNKPDPFEEPGTCKSAIPSILAAYTVLIFIIQQSHM